MTMYGRSDLEQARINARKVARSAIRLKHSVAADNELNELMPRLERRLNEMLQQGLIPAMTHADIEELLNG